MRDELELTLFGSPEVRLHGLPVTGFRSSKAQALLYYLAVTSRPHTRSTLTGLLWGDQPDPAARASLSKCLSNLHDLIGDAVLIERQSIAFNRNCPYQLDTERFAAGIDASPTPETLQPLQAALALYRGDFLEGFYVRDAADFEQWVLVQRAQFREAIVQGVHALATFADQHGDLPHAIAHTRRLLSLEPWREEAHRQLMLLLARSGQRAAALAQFETCRRILDAELTVEPDVETLAVVAAIRSGELQKVTRPGYARRQGDKVNSGPDHPVTLSPPHLVRNNLPTPATPLIGRAREMAEVRELLGSNHLVVLTGIGGAGKTRLALATASAMVQETTLFDATCWVDLTSITSAALLPQTIAAALGLFEQTEQPIERTLINYLQARRLLLLLDRCEHLVEACAQVCRRLLQNCSQLHIFATSRELLHLAEEVVYQVPPLALPEPQLPLPTPDRLLPFAAGFDAVKFFVARAMAVPGDFQLSSQNAATVLQLCQRLDGIPLALELAAARLNILSLPQILERLDQRLQLLRQTLYGGSPQQQSLVASLDWSYELLSDQERMLLRRLAVFVREFALEAVEAVCADADLPASAIMDTLARLADKSLVVVERANQPHPSFRLLDTIQAYALEKCAASGEIVRLRQAHLAFYLQLAQTAAPHLRAAEQSFWFSQLAYAYDNLRAALEFAISHDHEAALELVGSLGWFWYMRGYLSEGRYWLETVLAADPEVTKDQSQLTLDQAKRRGAALYYAAMLAFMQSDYVMMQEQIATGLRLCRQYQDEHGIANLQSVLLFSKLIQGEFTLAAQLVQDCIRLYRACQDRWGLAYALHTWGFILWQQAKYDQARPALEESVQLFNLLGDSVVGVFPLALLGSLAVQQGHRAQGEAILAECVALVNTLGDTLATDWVMAEYAHLARYQGDYRRAEELYRTVLAAARVKGHRYNVTEMLRFLGLLAIAQGEYPKARALLLEALALCQRRDKRNVVLCLAALAALPDPQPDRSFAVQLLSIVSAQMTTHEMGLAPIDRALFEQTSDHVRRHVEADLFALAWAAGQAMTLDDAVAYALANPEATAAGSPVVSMYITDVTSP
jgi:predicted ATPase/DNA-binding SARP family transcriptional activator